jgi:cob(I)alamin adenosyltransferase
MSIATKTGDDGTTGLMYNRRVSKCHPRVEAYGAVDELNAALGSARAMLPGSALGEQLFAIQKKLVIVMGELATAKEDLARFVKDGFSVVTRELTVQIDAIVREIEAQDDFYKDWATPGANPAAAALDVARVTCRRAERRVCALDESGQMNNGELIVFLNRLSDALWLMARRAEKIA